MKGPAKDAPAPVLQSTIMAAAPGYAIVGLNDDGLLWEDPILAWMIITQTCDGEPHVYGIKVITPSTTCWVHDISLQQPNGHFQISDGHLIDETAIDEQQAIELLRTIKSHTPMPYDAAIMTRIVDPLYAKRQQPP